MYSVLPRLKLMNLQVCCWLDPKLVVKCTGFSCGQGVAVRRISYWYTPRSELWRVTLPVACPTLRGKYSNIHLPSLCAPMMKLEGSAISATLELAAIVTGLGRGLAMVTTYDTDFLTWLVRSILAMIPGGVDLKVTL